MRTRSIFLFLLILFLSLFLIREAEFSYYSGDKRKVISIEIELKGSYQEAIEEIITNPLEEELLSLEGLKTLNSVSEDEKALLILVFQDRIPLNRAYLEVRERVDRVYGSYPDRTQKPRILKSDNQAFPVFILMLEEEEGWDKEQLTKLLQSVAGVGRVDAGGAPSKNVVLEYREKVLEQYGMSETDLASVIRNNNRIVSIPMGPESILAGDFRYTSLSSFSQQSLKEGILLGELVHPLLSDADTSRLSRVNGEEKTLYWIRKAGDANTIRLCRDLRKLKGLLPPYTILYDRGWLIEEALKDVGWAILAGIVAVLLVTGAMMRDLRNSLLLCLNIPFSLCTALAVITLTGREIDMMVLSGAALGTGMVIDAGVVFLESGPLKSRKPVFYSLLSTLLVFASLLFAPQDILENYLPLALTISLILTVSLFYLYRIMPGLMLKRAAGITGNTDLLIRKILRHIFRNPWPWGGFVLLALILNLMALSRLPFQMDMLLKDGNINFSMEYPAGTTLDAVQKDLAFLEEKIAGWEDVSWFSSEYLAEKARFQLNLRNSASENLRTELEQRLRRDCEPVMGTLFFENQDRAAGYEILLTGYNRDLLYKSADSLSWYLQAESFGGPLVQHYKQPLPELTLFADPSRLSEACLLPSSLLRLVSASLTHPVRAKWQPPVILDQAQNSYDIKILQEMTEQDERIRIEQLHILPEEGPGQVLNQFVRWEERPDHGRIYHYNGLRGVSLSSGGGNSKGRKIYSRMDKLLNEFPFPDSIRYSHGERQKEQRDNTEMLLLCVLLSLVLIFLLLLYFFESLALPLFLFGQLPLCLLSPMGALYLLDLPLSAPVFFAMILVIGISVNNGIVLFCGLGKHQLNRKNITAAFEKRSASLLMAFVTTLAGIVPLLLSGSSGRNALGGLTITICFGLAASLFSLIVLTPLCFGRSAG